MTKLGTVWKLAGLMTVLLAWGASGAEGASAPPDFKEVYDLVREHAGGISQEELDQAAIKGLLMALNPRVSLVTNPEPRNAAAASVPVVKSNLFDGEIAYVRIGRINEGLAKAVRAAYDDLKGTNKLKGVVLDLRYSGGDDYAEAAAVVDLFLKKEEPLLNWGNGIVKSKAKKDAITAPVAALVNRQTEGSAEAIAAAIRQTGTGLILGGRTAGQAMVAKDYPLKNGQQLRIATARIEVGDNTTISPEGVKPDIQVDVRPEDERQYYADAFKVIARSELAANATLSLTNQGAATNRTTRRRFNEAELVRERKEGPTFDQDAGEKSSEPERPVVRDPVLARALDLLKGLAVVRPSS
jgi:C-terminal processing protease CtpA/Prc